MSGRSGIMMIVAIVCGLGAMYGAQKMLKDDQEVPQYQEVLAAARDLKIEEVLTPDMVEVVKVRVDAVPPGAFESFKNVAERWVKIPILKGETIVDAKLAPKGTPTGILARIPDGMMAYAIEVNEQSGVSGFVLPENRVDVILSRDRGELNKPGRRKAPEAETVLENALVLASGTAVTRPDDPSIQARTVTLALTQDAIKSLVAARTHGNLTLALRGHNSDGELKIVRHMEEINAEDEPKTELPPVPVPAPEPVKPLEPAPIVVQVAPPPPARKKVPCIIIHRGPGRTEHINPYGCQCNDPENASTSQPADLAEHTASTEAFGPDVVPFESVASSGGSSTSALGQPAGARAER